MLEFQLFRAKVYPSGQLQLFEPPAAPADILQQAIEDLPSSELRTGITWHIGNLMTLADCGLYFRIGRISKSTIEVYHDGAFIDEEFETAPYTHVVMDIPLGVCAIAKKPKLSRYVQGIANQFGRLLDRSEAADRHKAQFDIDAISDPEDLISYLDRAVSVSKFWVTFKRPNPFDANADFIQPMQRLLSGSGASKGKTEIEGKDLAVKSLEELARSAAATGDEATARMFLEPNRTTVKKSLRGNPVVLQQEDLADTPQRDKLLQRMRNAYQKVRGGKDGG